MTEAQITAKLDSIPVILGRAFRETEPFSLYPLDEYFSGNRHGMPVAPTIPPASPRPQALRPPMAQTV
jgi:hypothetical protein